jgi:hypothetical protein
LAEYLDPEELVLLLEGKFGELDFGDDLNGSYFVRETENVELDQG